MGRLKLMVDDHGKEFASLKDRLTAVEKTGGGSADTLTLKSILIH